MKQYTELAQEQYDFDTVSYHHSSGSLREKLEG